MVMNLARLSSRVLVLTQSTVIWGWSLVNSLALSWYCSVSEPAPAQASQVTVTGPLGAAGPLAAGCPPPGAPGAQAARRAAGTGRAVESRRLRDVIGLTSGGSF